jgi:hypothetical protein
LDWIDCNYLVFNINMWDRAGLTAIIWSSIVNMWDRASFERGIWDGLMDYGIRLDYVAY